MAKKIIDPKYARVFGPAKSDRLVVKKSDGDYIILPIAGWGMYYFLKNIFPCKFCGQLPKLKEE
jgi:hypothetical protein